MSTIDPPPPLVAVMNVKKVWSQSLVCLLWVSVGGRGCWRLTDVNECVNCEVRLNEVCSSSGVLLAVLAAATLWPLNCSDGGRAGGALCEKTDKLVWSPSRRCRRGRRDHLYWVLGRTAPYLHTGGWSAGCLNSVC